MIKPKKICHYFHKQRFYFELSCNLLTSFEKKRLTLTRSPQTHLSVLFISLQRVAANNHRRTSTASSRKPSLALGDTPDVFRDLGHLELMSRELDPTGLAQLNRSISTDSLSSISSIANNFGHDFTVGQLEVTLEFEASRQPGQGVGLLHITLHQGKDLLEREEGDFPGCFIRVSLGPEELNVGVTRVS